jgi:ribonucleoside-diphosphate reductase alpha chain
MSANIAFDLIELHSDYRILVNRILDDREKKVINNIKKNTLNDTIYIIRSNGTKQELDITLIYKKIHMLINMEPKLNITGDVLITKTINELADNITSEDIDFIASKNAANLISTNLDYNILASRIVINRIHKKIHKNYLDYVNNINDKLLNYFKPQFTLFVKNYYNEINEIIDYSKDYNFKYIGISILIKSYLIVHNKIPIESPQQMYMRIAINLHLDDLDENGYFKNYTMNDIKKLYDLISDGYYTHATPTIFNSGNNVGSLSSCFLLDMDDTTMGIYGTLAESAMISKSSGGIGINITKIRGKNSRIASSNGISEGLVPMLKVYDDMAKHMSQGGGKRKGSIAMYFELWHVDVMDVLECILPTNTIDEMACPRDLFYAAWTNDIFWQRLEYAILNPNELVLWSLFCPNDVIDDNNTHLSDLFGENFTNKYIEYEQNNKFKSQINILDIWNKILKVLEEAGKLYILSKSSSNLKCNQNNLGTIKSSNLCVHKNTLVLTDQGYQYIKDLVDQDVNIWNGNEFSLSPVRKTGENQKLLLVTTDDGCKLKCTKYHKFHIVSGARNTKHIIKETHELEIGDRLIKCNFPTIDGNKENNFKYAYTHGFYCGDGTNINKLDGDRKIPIIDLYHDKQKLEQYIEHDHKNNKQIEQNKTRYILHNDIEEKFKVPINATLQNKLEWLAGYIDADGCIVKNQDSRCIQICSIHKEFLVEVKYLCNTLGCNPKVIKQRDEKQQLIPNNKGNNELQLYNCKEQWRLLFNVSDTFYLYNNLQLPTKRVLNDIDVPPQRDARKFVRILSIEEVDGLHDTYCFNEPINHTGIFNGIITGNCSEILIYTDKDNIGVCNLASICLPKFMNLETNTYDYNKLIDISYDVCMNLNKVLKNNVYPLERARYNDDNNRPIGIGVQGLADVFMMFKCSYTSDKAKNINKKIFECIYYGALKASCDLAKKYGSYNNYSTSMTAKGLLQYDLWNIDENNLMNDWKHLRNNINEYGLYNSLLIALMPTASTSAILDNNENFEPITSNIYNRSLLSGDFQVVNKYLIQDLKELNLWDNYMRELIIAHNGSIQNIDIIPNNIKEIYKTAYEYKLKDIIDMDSDRGAFVCQSMSSNRFISDFNRSKITSMYLYAYKKGLKTLSYYIRTKTNVNAIKFTIDQNILKTVNKKNKDEEEEECTMCSA